MRKRSRSGATMARNSGAVLPKPPASVITLQDRWWFSATVTWLALFAAVFIVYFPALHGARLWDDSSHITRPDLQSIHGLWRIWFEVGATQQYYPVLHSAFWLEHHIWGDSVAGYHLINLVLHATAAALAVFIARYLKLSGSLLAGFLFALHPVCVEGVAWISEQKSTLSGVFCLAAMLCYLHFENRRRKDIYLVATGFFALALLSKSVTAVAAPGLLVLAWWRYGRIHFRRDLAPLLPWFAMGASMGLLTASIERSFVVSNGTLDHLTIPQHIILAGRIVVFYLSKLVVPINLAFSYPRWKISPDQIWQYSFVAAIIVAGAAFIWGARRNRGPLASLLIFIVTLFPVLGFFAVYPFRYSWVADHFQYLASLAVLIPVSSLFVSLLDRYVRNKRLGTAVVSCLVASLAVLTWNQSSIYRNEEALFRATILHNPDSWLAHNNLGTILLSQPGRLPEAIEEFQTAVRLEPAFPESHFNLASAWTHETPPRFSDAVSEYQTALRLKPDDSEALGNLGNVLMRLPGRREDAIRAYRKATQLAPDRAVAHQNLGTALAQTPDTLPEAIREFQTALRLSPDSAELHANLGSALAEAGKFSEAVPELETATRLQPDAAIIHYNLGNALEQMPGRSSEALTEFRTAVNLEPGFAEAREAVNELEHAQ